MKYAYEYGCYLGMEYGFIETNMFQAEVERNVYDLAREVTDDFLGMHGFLCDCYDEDTDELCYGECCKATVEDALEYMVEVYDPEKHDDYEDGGWG